MKLRLLFVFLMILFAVMVSADALTDYVNKDDGAYSFKISKTQLSADMQVSVTSVDFASQTWNNSKLNHKAQIFYPLNALVTDTALVIAANGESNDDWVQTASYISKYMLSPVVVIYLNPTDESSNNLYIKYVSDLYADAENSGNVPLKFIDAKTIIKGMDAIAEVTHNEFDRTIESFVLAGSENCADSVYLAAATGDKRISGIIPVNCDLNKIKCLEHQFDCYKVFSPTVTEKNTDKLYNEKSNEKIQTYFAKTDPYTYLNSIKCPVLVITGTNNPSSVIDNAKYYYKDIKNEKYFWLKMNGSSEICFTENTMKTSNISDINSTLTIVNCFFYHITKAAVMEKVNFVTEKTGNGYTITADGNCADVQQAYIYETDSEYLDFRNTFWSKTTLTFKNNTYTFSSNMPKDGHRCIIMELVYNSPVTGTYSVFSQPYILGLDK